MNITVFYLNTSFRFINRHVVDDNGFKLRQKEAMVDRPVGGSEEGKKRNRTNRTILKANAKILFDINSIACCISAL